MRKPWEEFEDAVIRRFYASMGAKRLTKTLNRSPESIRGRAMRLGIKKNDAHGLVEEAVEKRTALESVWGPL